MVTLDPSTFDHKEHMQKAIELAENAAKRGDKPYGATLVHNDTIVMTESNREITENDIRRHPELHLAYRACKGFDAEKRSAMVMYTSTEPCPMCVGGLQRAQFAQIFYSVGMDEIPEEEQSGPTIPAQDLLDGTEVRGPLLNEEGLSVHREYRP